ncbi:MAG TPA: META domain-containing protein [Acidimicrobiia bacterium]|nr:META domain-containing protein [Acidimicrobiia bacterium]
MDDHRSGADEVWRLLEYGRADDRTTVPIDVTVTLRLDDGRVSGLAGCNRYTGSAFVDGGHIALGPLAMTLRMCLPEVMEIERAYVTLLEVVDSIAIVEGRLVMSARGDPVLVFGHIAFRVSGTWLLDSYNNGRQAMVSVLPDTEVTAAFDDVGTVTGSSGCNRYRATFRAVDGEMTFGPPVGTRMMCEEPSGVMDQERRYLEALTEVTRYEFDDDGTMRCLDSEGAHLLRYTPTSSDPRGASSPIDQAGGFIPIG